MLVPLGVVAVFSASNFPLAFSVCGGDTASALAAGCPVVVKAHSGHPRTSTLCARAARRGAEAAGFPAGVLGIVYGRDHGTELVRHPSVKAAGFTGSLVGGRALFDLAAARPEPIPFFGELGSINPVVVTAGACVERAATIGVQLAESATLSSGQFCTKPGLVLVPTGRAGDELVGALVDRAAQVPAVRMLTPSISDAFVEGAADRAARASSTTLLAHPGTTAPYVLETHANTLEDVFLEECFGPLVVLVRYDSDEEVLAVLARVSGSLTTTIHRTIDEAKPNTIVDRVHRWAVMHSGRIIFNGVPTGVAVAWAMQHGGPFPAATSSQHTSVGATAIRRFLRPISYQDAPASLLPADLHDDTRSIPRRVDGVLIVP